MTNEYGEDEPKTEDKETCDECGRPNGTEAELETTDFDGETPAHCFAHMMFDGDEDPFCVRGAHAKVLEGKERRIRDLETSVVTLQERVAHAEVARDNALTMRDEVMAQKKQAGESASRRIEALINLARRILDDLTDSSEPHDAFGYRDKYEKDLAAILSKDGPSPIEKIKALRDTGVPLAEAKKIVDAGLTAPEKAATEAVRDIAEREVARLAFALKNNMSIEDVVIGSDGEPAYKPFTKDEMRTLMPAFQSWLDASEPPPTTVETCPSCNLDVDYCDCFMCGGCDTRKPESEGRYLPKARMWLCKTCDEGTPAPKITASVSGDDPEMVANVKITVDRVLKKNERCGVKDDRGRPCVRDKDHTPDGAGVGLHVTDDGRGFHGPTHKYVGFEGTCLDCGKPPSDPIHPKDRDGAA